MFQVHSNSLFSDKHVGTFLQKMNIIRDFQEDTQERRYLAPCDMEHRRVCPACQMPARRPTRRTPSVINLSTAPAAGHAHAMSPRMQQVLPPR